MRMVVKSLVILSLVLFVSGAFLGASVRTDRPIETSRVHPSAPAEDLMSYFDQEEFAFVAALEGNDQRAVEVVERVLGLDPGQTEEMLLILETAQDASSGLRELIRELEQQLHEALNEPEPDETLIGSLVLNIREVRLELAPIHAEALRDIVEDVLNEDQAKRLAMVRVAWRLKPVLPAFRTLGLLPYHRHRPGDE